MTDKQLNIWVADFETESYLYYEKYDHTKVWLSYVENLNSEESHLAVNIHKFYRFIEKQFNNQKQNQYVYFHNLSFDGTFILYYLNDHDIKYETVINDQKRIYEIKVFPSKANRHISFRCSYLIFPVAVSDLPHSTKTKIDYLSIRNYKRLEDVPPKEIEYIKQDVRTVKRNLVDLTHDYGVDLAGYFKTLSSISYKELKDMTSDMLREKGRSWSWYFPNLSLEADAYIRKSYRGGFSYLNPEYKGVVIDQQVGSWDITSSYPFRMKDNYLPAGKVTLTKKAPPPDKLYIIRIRIATATIKKGHHPFINPDQKMRYLNDIYPDTIEKTILSLTSVHYDLFKKYYDAEYEIMDYAVFQKKVKGIFNRYIDKTYQLKLDSKKLKKSKNPEEHHRGVFGYFWAKRKLNAPCGKFGSNPLVLSSEPVFEDGLLTWNETEEEKEENKFYLPMACFITAYGMKALIDQVQANKERFVYTDTDSIHLIGTDVPESLKPYIGTDLGKWEYEGTSYKSKFIKPKQYLKLKQTAEGENFIMLDLKRTICSLNRSEHDRIHFGNFASGITIKDGKKIARNVKGGRIIKPLDFTFK